MHAARPDTDHPSRVDTDPAGTRHDAAGMGLATFRLVYAVFATDRHLVPVMCAAGVVRAGRRRAGRCRKLRALARYLRDRNVREGQECKNGGKSAHNEKLQGGGNETSSVRPAQRRFLYIRSINSSYIGSASSGPALIAEVAQCFKWFRMSSRPTPRSASCTDEIWVRMSAQ